LPKNEGSYVAATKLGVAAAMVNEALILSSYRFIRLPATCSPM
jgi:hypothetical protein